MIPTEEERKDIMNAMTIARVAFERTLSEINGYDPAYYALTLQVDFLDPDSWESYHIINDQPVHK